MVIFTNLFVCALVIAALAALWILSCVAVEKMNACRYLPRDVSKEYEKYMKDQKAALLISFVLIAFTGFLLGQCQVDNSGSSETEVGITLSAEDFMRDIRAE